MKVNFIITLCFVHLLLPCKCQYIQKCCDRTKQLALNFDTCIDYYGDNEDERYETDNDNNEQMQFVKFGKNSSHHIWWLLPNIKFVSLKPYQLGYKLTELSMNNLTIEFLYDTKFPCLKQDSEIVPFTDYVYLLENGSLLITNVDDNVRPKTMMFPYNSYCLDRISLINPNAERDNSVKIFDHSYAIILCPCSYMPCIRMCCQWKHFLNFSRIPNACEYSPNISLKWNLNYMDDNYNEKRNVPGQFSIVKNIPNCPHEAMYLNEDVAKPNKKFWILSNGNIKAESFENEINFKDYCVTYWHLNGSFQPNLRICKNPGEFVQFENVLYGCYFLVGSFFSALTLFIYGAVEELRDSLHAQYLILHVSCLLVTTVVMALREFFKLRMHRFTCVGIAYIAQFSFIASTLWLNIICINMYHSFKDFQGTLRLLKNSKKKFITNSVYVWGISLSISIITAIADNTDIFNHEYRPRFAGFLCWFGGDVPKFLYFYFPVTLIVLHNLILFLFIVRKILKSFNNANETFNNESRRHSQTNVNDMQRFKVYLKLFALMGVSWIFEILSWFIGGQTYYWYFTDALNALHGLFIFIILCCKKTVYLSLLNKFKNKGNEQTKQFTSSGENSIRTISSNQFELTDISNRSDNRLVFEKSRPNDFKK